MKIIRNPNDFFTGLILLAIASVFAYGLRQLPIGTAFQMGPGYFPLVLTALLAVLALIIMANGFRGEGESIESMPWRGLTLITISIVIFSVTLKGLGLIPSLALSVFVSTFADRGWKPLPAILTTALIVPSAYLIFVKGLALPIVAFGSWLTGH